MRIKYGWINLGNDFDLEPAAYVSFSTSFGNFILKLERIA